MRRPGPRPGRPRRRPPAHRRRVAGRAPPAQRPGPQRCAARRPGRPVRGTGGLGSRDVLPHRRPGSGEARSPRSFSGRRCAPRTRWPKPRRPTGASDAPASRSDGGGRGLPTRPRPPPRALARLRRGVPADEGPPAVLACPHRAVAGVGAQVPAAGAGVDHGAAGDHRRGVEDTDLLVGHVDRDVGDGSVLQRPEVALPGVHHRVGVRVGHPLGEQLPQHGGVGVDQGRPAAPLQLQDLRGDAVGHGCPLRRPSSSTCLSIDVQRQAILLLSHPIRNARRQDTQMSVLQFALLGLGLGGAYALLALGLVMIYRGTGVLNFAQGAVAMICAYVFFALRDDLGWPVAAAGVLTLLFATVLGLAFYLLVMRQLRNSPVLARIIATLALLLLLQGLATLLFDVRTKTPPSVVPAAPVTVLGTAIPMDRVILAAVAVALAAALALVSRHTRAGLAVRAISDSEKGASLSGLSPVLIGAATWA